MLNRLVNLISNMVMKVAQIVTLLQLKFWPRTIYWGIVNQFSLIKKESPNKSYTDHLGLAVQTCADWRKIGADEFIYKSGELLKIDENDTLLSVIHKVNNIELNFLLDPLFPPEYKSSLIKKAHNDIDKLWQKNIVR